MCPVRIAVESVRHKLSRSDAPARGFAPLTCQVHSLYHPGFDLRALPALERHKIEIKDVDATGILLEAGTGSEWSSDQVCQKHPVHDFVCHDEGARPVRPNSAALTRISASENRSPPGRNSATGWPACSKVKVITADRYSAE